MPIMILLLLLSNGLMMQSIFEEENKQAGEVYA